MSPNPNARIAPATTHAVVVGIERYRGGADWTLPGPAENACEFMEWLVGRGVPAENIHAFLSPREQFDGHVPPGIATCDATVERFEAFVLDQLPELHAELLVVFWGGHGFSDHLAGRRLFYPDAHDANYANLNFNNFIERLRARSFLKARMQICIVDACATRWRGGAFQVTLPDRQFPFSRLAEPNAQYVLFGATLEQAAENLSADRTGLFSREVLDLLKRESSDEWPPSASMLQALLIKRFEELGRSGKATQVPDFLVLTNGDLVTVRGGVGPGTTTYADDFANVRHQDWGDAPSTGFKGRQDEIGALAAQLTNKAHRVVLVRGFPGVGKTSLVSHTARSIAGSFDRVVWRSLRNAPIAPSLLEDLIRSLGPRHTEVAPTLDGRIRQLTDLLTNSSSLVVLTRFEALSERGGSAGRLSPQHQHYEDVLQSFVSQAHTSVVVIVGDESPTALRDLAQTSTFVNEFDVGAVSVADARAIVEKAALRGDDESWRELVDRVSGNIDALRICVSEAIDLYGGDLAEYLRNELSGEATQIGDAILQRIPDNERLIVYRLAAAREPLTVAELDALDPLGTSTARPQSSSGLLRSMRNRSVVRPAGGSARTQGAPTTSRFALPRVLADRATVQLLDTIADEIVRCDPELLARVRLARSTKESVSDAQRRLVVEPIADLLRRSVGQEEARNAIGSVLDAVRSTTGAIAGATAANAVAVLAGLGSSIKGGKLQRLDLRGSDFRDVELHDVDLSGSDLTGASFREPFAIALSVAYDPRGEYLIAAFSDSGIRMWSTRSHELIRTFDGHRGWVWAIAISPDGRTLASASDDKTVRLWDVTSGAELHRLVGHNQWVRTVAFSPDGSTVASGGADATVRLWRVRDGSAAGVLSQHTDQIWSVAYNPMTGRLASGGSDSRVYVWDGVGAEPIAGWQADEGRVLDLTFSPDGQSIATAGDSREVRIWTADGHERRATLQGHTRRIWSVAFSPDGSRLVSSSEDGTARVWNWQAAPVPAPRILVGHANFIRTVAVAPDGNGIATASDDHSVREWDVASGAVVHIRRGYSDPVVALTFVGDGHTLAAGCSDNSVRLWNVEDWSFISAWHENKVWSVAASPNGRLIASSSDDQTVRLWDAVTLEPMGRLPEHDKPIWAVAFSPDSKRLAVSGEEGTITLFSVDSRGVETQLPGHGTWARTLAFSPNGDLLASGGDDLLVRLWDAKTGAQLGALAGHSERLWRVAFNGDGSTLATAAEDGTVRLWDVRTRRELHRFDDHDGCVWCVAFSPGGKLLASAGSDGTVRTWDVATREPRKVLTNYSTWVQAVCFDRSGRKLASASRDGRVDMWRADDLTPYVTLRKDRPYERTRIRESRGLTAAQRASLVALGAIDD